MGWADPLRQRTRLGFSGNLPSLGSDLLPSVWTTGQRRNFFELGKDLVFFILYRFQRDSLTVSRPCPSRRVVSSMYASSFISPIISVSFAIIYVVRQSTTHLRSHLSLAAHLIHVHNSHFMSCSSYLNPLCVRLMYSIHPIVVVAVHSIMIPFTRCIPPISLTFLPQVYIYISCPFLHLSHPCL